MTPDVGDGCVLAPAVEDARVRSLQQLEILDTPSEERFGRITKLARQALSVPMASVNLIDRDRQWFKQADGLNLGGQTTRRDSVCQATIARSYEHPEDPALVLEDAAAVPFFAKLPVVGGEGGIRFYAGYPLYGPGGHPVGTFCIYDTQPRKLDTDQFETFRELAGWVQRELEHSEEMERAGQVQRHLLPRPLEEMPGYEVCALCMPAFVVGGDFYDHYPVQRGVVFTVADVMGKGLGAAILTASVRAALRAASRAVDETSACPDLADAVNAVAAQLADDLASTETFVTLFHARLDTAEGVVRYVDAGHGFAVVVRNSGVVEPLSSDGLPLGVLSDDTWVSKDVAIQPGETLVIASDGVLDLIGDGSDVRPALEFVADHADPAELCCQARALAATNAPLDDITLVAIRRRPVE
jgi:GAF domain-containing protein